MSEKNHQWFIKTDEMNEKNHQWFIKEAQLEYLPF